MRSTALIISAIVGAVMAVLAPVPAHAQSLDRILGVITGATAYGYNSCGYVKGGVRQASCQTNRAVTVLNTMRQAEQRDQQRRRQEFDRRTRQLNALQRACQAGDEQSCARSGGTDPRQMQVARALMDACTAGDRPSCRRAEAMMNERNVTASYDARDGYERQAYQPAPTRYAQTPSVGYAQPASTSRQITISGYDQARGGTQHCRPVLDPRTGYRVPGQFDCR